MDYNTAMRVFRGSKRFEFNGTVLTIWDYYDSQSKVVIDFANMTPDILEQLAPGMGVMSICYNEDDDVWEVWDDVGEEMWHYFDTKEEAIEWCEDNDYDYEMV